jgi:uncharacterized protein
VARETGVHVLMTKLMTAEDPAHRAQIDEFLDALIDQRNVRMVERMTPRLAAGGALIAVGARHLPGERGILSLLAERGYRISQVC